MIDWESPTWGGGVTLAENGSWSQTDTTRIKGRVDLPP